MMVADPRGELDARFSMPAAGPVSWSEVRSVLERQEMACLSTVRADGRPHVTPLIFAWTDGRLLVHSGVGEQKMNNLEVNPRCVLTVAQPDWESGLDVVVEGEAVRITDRSSIEVFAAALAKKYGEFWTYQVDDNGLYRDGAADASGVRPVVLEIVPSKVLAFGRGEDGALTRFRFTSR